MEQTKALNALEPFLALSKSATSPRAAIDLINRATSAPNAFIFTELLETPQIQALATAGDAYPQHLALLEIFSHGTWASLSANPALPPLNDAQQLKLRQLTLLTLARTARHPPDDASSPPVLSYASLLSTLSLPDAPALEDLVISAVYAGLLSAKLDPLHSRVHIHRVSPLRDVAPGGTTSLLTSLRSWAGRCEATLHSLESQMSALRAAANQRAADATARRDRTAALVDAEKKSASSSLLPSGPSAAAVRGQRISVLTGIGFSGGDGGSPRGSRGRATRSSSSAAAAAAAATAAAGAAAGASGGGGSGEESVKTASKRGSGDISDEGDWEDAGMDLDGEEGEEGKKRASRRKLQV